MLRCCDELLRCCDELLRWRDELLLGWAGPGQAHPLPPCSPSLTSKDGPGAPKDTLRILKLPEHSVTLLRFTLHTPCPLLSLAHFQGRAGHTNNTLRMLNLPGPSPPLTLHTPCPLLSTDGPGAPKNTLRILNLPGPHPPTIHTPCPLSPSLTWRDGPGTPTTQCPC